MDGQEVDELVKSVETLEEVDGVGASGWRSCGPVEWRGRKLHD